MRSETLCAPTSTFLHISSNSTLSSAVGAANSPPAADIWSTERRLEEKQPPGAPISSRRRRSSVTAPTLDNVTLFPPLVSKKHRSDCLLLPSRTIDEDDDKDYDDYENKSPHVTLSFRPTRLFFDTEPSFGFSQTEDPTTVLLVPEQTRLWQSDSLRDYEEDDTALSPRLFQFGGQALSRYIVLDVAEADESEFIFRQRGNVEDRESSSTDDHDARLFSRAPTMGRCFSDEDRV